MVGASASLDERAGFLNFGKCVDLFAPGVSIISALPWSDVDRGWMDGTSMASPHAAGAAALYLQGRPDASPTQVAAALVAGATPGLILDAGPETPNRLLFTPHFGDTTPPIATILEPAEGATVRGLHTVRIAAEDDIELASVTGLACGSVLGSPDRLVPYSVSWDTTSSPAGRCSWPQRCRSKSETCDRRRLPSSRSPADH